MGINSFSFNPSFIGYRVQEKAMSVLDNAQEQALTIGDVDTYSRHVPKASFEFAIGEALNMNEANWRASIASPTTSNVYNKVTKENLTPIENNLAKSAS